MELDTACLDWQQRIEQGRSLVPPLPLDENEAARAVRIFNRLQVPDLIGKPPLSEAGGEWFRDIVRAVFGSYDPGANYRAIQEVFLLVPKKNGKSTYSAAVMVTAIIMNRRPNAELLLIAPTKEIADIAFGQAAGMIDADEELSKRYHRQQHIRTITDLRSGAKLKVVAADTDAITGVKATFTLIDETHVFASKSRASHVFIEVRGALASRPDGFLWQITTQSKEPPAGVFKSELEFARKVRDGAKRFPMLAVLYELPERLAADDGWKAPERLAMVNPNLGRSVSLDFLTREIDKAEDGGRETLALIASQHANVEVGIGLKTDGWAGVEVWSRGVEPGLTLESILERCEVVTCGIDGGGLDDLFGFAVVGREIGTRRWLAWCHALIGPEGLKRRKANEPQYRDFEAAGDLTIVESLPEDLEWLQATVGLILDSGKLGMVGADPAGIGGAVDALAEIGVTEEAGLLIGVAQGIKLMGAHKAVERKLADGSFVHGGSPLMNWCVGNARMRQTSTAVLVERSASGYGKIDPFMALLNAAHLMSLNPEPKHKPSVYEERGVVAY